MTDAPTTQKLIPTLYNLASSQGFRVLWALEELNAEYGTTFRLKNYPRKRPERPQDLEAVHVLGKSPIVTLATTDGSPPPTIQIDPGVLTESHLILRWLAKEYDVRGIWKPESEEDKKRDRFFQDFAVATSTMKVDFALIFEMIPAAMPWPLSSLFGLLVKPIVAYWMTDINPIFQLMEDHLDDERPWFSGKKCGLADFNVSFGMDIADARGYFQREKYPKLCKWFELVRARPGYQRALKRGGDYDLKTFGLYKKSESASDEIIVA